MEIKIEDLKNNYRESHTSRCAGYVSRKIEGVIAPYSGKFGKGYKLLSPAYDSTRYCFVTYFLEK